MDCALCDGKLISKTGVIEFTSKTLGTVFVPGIRHQVCKQCGDILIAIEESARIIDHVKTKEQRAIERLPISEFISLNEASARLGITKQAFSKNPKIKNGLIYSVKIGGRRYYSKKSVDTFKSNGDGRYPIPKKGNVTELLKKTRKPMYVMANLYRKDFTHKKIFLSATKKKYAFSNVGLTDITNKIRGQYNG